MYWLNRLGIRTGRHGNLPTVGSLFEEASGSMWLVTPGSPAPLHTASTSMCLRAVHHNIGRVLLSYGIFRVWRYTFRGMLVLLQYVFYYVCQHLWFVIKCWVYRYCIVYFVCAFLLLSLSRVWVMEIYVSKWRTGNFKLGHLRCVLQSYQIG